MSTRVVHYLNQFFAGIGGEEHAGIGVSVRDGAIGPGRALAQALGDRADLVATVVCGDNFVNDRADEALPTIREALRAAKPDVVIAGPAFGSGRYGIACAQVCLAAAAGGIPAIAAMHGENPGAAAHRTQVVIVPTGETATSLAAVLPVLARLALKLAAREALGPAELEGYLSQGKRVVHDRGRPGYHRAIDMLLDKLHGRPYVSEVPFRAPERVTPAAPIHELAKARIGMVTTGGLVRKGNPERQAAAGATRFHRHSVAELEGLTPEGWEAYHAGYFNHIVNKNPNYVLPLSFLRDLEKRGTIGRVHEWIYALPGVSTPVAVSQRLGREIAADLKAGGVEGVLLVAT